MTATTPNKTTDSTANSPTPYTGFDRLFIGGRWVTGRSEHKLKPINPYHQTVIMELAAANQRDLEDAYQEAKQAQVAWADTPPSQRSHIMRRATDIMDARQDEIISWSIREAGSPRKKAMLEWKAARDVMEQAVFAPYAVEGRILPSDIPGKESRVYRRPVGVVAVVSPWDFALNLANRSVAPALALGNAVVLKPPSNTPVTGGLIFAKIFEEAGLPPGVLSVVAGPAREIGDAFVSHPIPRVVTFTGSTKAGRHIGELAVSSPIMKRASLELGGNSPLVVLDDADLELAVNAAVFGKFLNSGQICMSTNRLIVDEHVYDEFVDRFVDRVRQLKLGDPNDPDTDIGPIINEAQLNAHLQHIENGRQEGARQLLGGDPDGLMLPPHVFAEVTNRMNIAQEELFGPIAPIIKVRNEADALQVANDTEYGLASAVFTRDEGRGLRFAQRMDAGMTHINDQTVNDLPNAPFGGEKNSGIGRFGGDWAIAEFTTDHWITVQHSPRTYPL
ncbi:aldehyde dehydrogenase family protein [Oculatella sp. LEGE 06141]|uniref:aldehyde dehydrogenase family protein n=1 Tax=Oculatella sp. LEGE 06141 TaxID=1828648 RepID=UPI00187E5307|nr:aldehyde dehydrogenase family protein [Oculatella sp. LEGE 06141]MBE9177805.1 aldehyde dehydrogenase family protein [Oculatella sp. LEGE 06141]